MRAVFFDLDGTLVELPEDFAGLFEATLREHGVGSDADSHDLHDYHEQYMEAFFDHLADCHPEPYRAAMADLRESADLPSNPDALAETYTEREARATAIRPSAREMLEVLDSGGPDAPDTPDLALGVLTNGGARAQRRKLAHHGIAGQFRAVVVSGEVGASKPDSEIFAAAEDAIPADEHVFVADDLERDVVPAQEAGFTGVYLADEDPPEDAEERANHVVESLGEVPDVVR
ncbi:HAD family hydrolase [Halorussus litoreus]|uniref:HAD family hydrolase n=1 Tax=Halorussus litoreus TaxID=1710536 RepID=UPI0013001DE5|nr:HAD family hydrolase [Halorussus litoreus]